MMSVRHTFNVPVISNSMTHDDPVMGKNYIIYMNEGLHSGEIIDRIIFNPNKVRNYGIKSQDNPDYHNSKLCIEADD